MASYKVAEPQTVAEFFQVMAQQLKERGSLNI